MAGNKQPTAAEKAAATRKANAEKKAKADAEAKAKADAEAQQQTAEPLECEVLEPQLYDGTKYMPGDFIYLTEEEAEPLIAQQLIRFGTPEDSTPAE